MFHIINSVFTIGQLPLSLSYLISSFLLNVNLLGGVMVSMVAPSSVNHEFEPRSDHSKDYEIGIVCFSTKHAALRRKSKDWVIRNQANVSECDDMSIRGLLIR